MVWHVTGDVGRVSRFVAMSQQAMPNGVERAAVSGLPKDRVSVPASAGCLRYFNDAKSSDGLRAANEFKALAGRAADDVIAAYGIGKVSLPTGIQDPDAKFPLTRLIRSPVPVPACGAKVCATRRAESQTWKQIRLSRRFP